MRIRDQATRGARITKLEGETSTRERGGSARGARWVLTNKTLKVLKRPSAIAARLLELRHGEERVVYVCRQRIFDDYSPIVTLRVSGCLC